MSRTHSHLKPPVGPGDHAQGPADAPVTLVEYGDYECPHCGRAQPVLKRVQERLGDRLRLVFRHFPLAEMHPLATGAAELAEAADAQGKFWPMHDTLFAHQDALEPPALLRHAQGLHLDVAKLEETIKSGAPLERVRADFMGGVRSGVNGTPAFFINGQRFDGVWSDADEFVSVLEAAAVAID